MTRGWYEMACWNGLSHEQQRLLIDVGVLPMGRWEPEGGSCPNGAEVAVETMHDTAPGPRFYCLSCAMVYLGALEIEGSDEDSSSPVLHTDDVDVD